MTEHVAIIGEGGETLVVLADLVNPSGGTLTVGDRDITELPEAMIGRRMSAVGSEPFLFPMSVRDNLLYGLRHRPLRPAELDAPPSASTISCSSNPSAPATRCSISAPIGSTTTPPAPKARRTSPTG